MAERKKILIADDSEINRVMLAEMLAEEYDILEASDGLEAMKILNSNQSEIALVLLDVVMPEMDGFGVLTAMNKAEMIDDIPVIVISAETDSSYTEKAYNLGAVEYINRPFDERTVTRRVKNTIMLYGKQKALAEMVTEQFLEKEKHSLVMLEILSHIVEFRNGEGGRHVLNIRIITEEILKALANLTMEYELTSEKIATISNASALHDIGKIVIPEHILNKPGPLTTEEYEVMKTHSTAGATMLERIEGYEDHELIKIARDICRWHHERYDGGGYPDGLVGEQIPIWAQVVALADVYDALLEVRVYKPAYSREEALDMITRGECGAFRPLLLRCLKEATKGIDSALAKRSVNEIFKDEIQSGVGRILGTSQTANKTLNMLEQERIKHQFFTSVANEIQFEYNEQMKLLTLSDWGAATLGIRSVIVDPEQDERIAEIFSPEDYLDLKNAARNANPNDPVIVKNYILNLGSERRWHRVVMRPLYLVNGDKREYTGIIGKFVDVHDERSELDRFKDLAKKDYLTGVFNKRYAVKQINSLLEENKGNKRNYMLMLLDLDFFEETNDNYGHMFGDQVLVQVASNMKRIALEGSVIARVGGDEFVFFTQFGEDIQVVADKVLRAVTGKYEVVDIKASMGIAVAPKDGDNFDELFKHADEALYAAKGSGRGRWCLYDKSMDDPHLPLSKEKN